MRRIVPFPVCVLMLLAAAACKQTAANSETKTRQAGAVPAAVAVPGGFGVKGELYPVLEGGKFGYIDGTGKMVIEPRYTMASRFSEDLALVLLPDKKKCGYIDREGKLAIEAKFDGGGPFSEGHAAVKIGKKTGVIDKKGDVAIDPTFQRIGRFHDGLAAAVIERESMGMQVADGGYIDGKGKFVIAPQFDPNLTAFSEGVAGVRRMGQMWSFIDRNDKTVLAPKYFMVGQFSDGLAGVMDAGGKWGFIDKTGKMAIPSKFQFVQQFSEGLAGVYTIPAKKWGFVDKTGTIAIHEQFDAVQPFEDGISFVRVGNKAGYINKEGKYVWPLTE